MSAGAEGIATANSPQAFGGAADCSVLLNCLDEVVAARRRESAVTPQKRAKEELVTTDSDYHQPGRKQNEIMPNSFHVSLRVTAVRARKGPARLAVADVDKPAFLTAAPAWVATKPVDGIPAPRHGVGSIPRQALVATPAG